MLFLRFGLVYFLTALIDYAVFWIVLRATGGGIFAAQLAGRAASIPFNYFAVRGKVFESQAKHQETAPKYVALYAVAFALSYLLIRAQADAYQRAWPSVRPDYLVLAAKMIAEGLILIAKYFVQRRWIFKAG